MNSAVRHFPYADGMRVVAIIAVVALHRSAVGVIHYGQIPSDQWWIANIVDSACRWAVPVFIMLSGCLNLSRTQQGNALPFLKKRFQRVGIPLLFWAPIYFACHHLFEGRELTLEFILSSLWRGLTINHLYFIFILLMLYLVTPLFDQLIARTSKTAITIIALLILITASSGAITSHIPMNAMTMFILYIPYYLSGYLLRPYIPDKKLIIFASVIFLTASAVIAIQTGNLSAKHGIEDPEALTYYDYFHPAVIVQSISMWLILSHLFSRPINGKLFTALKFLGRASFGVYLTHILFLSLLHFYMGSLFDEMMAWAIVSDVVLAFTASALFTSVLIKTPWLRGLVGERET